MKTILFSVSYAGLWGQHSLDLKAYIEKAAGLGYAAVELMAKHLHLSVLDADDELLERIRDCAEENEIEIATLAGYTGFTSGKSSSKVPFVETQVSYIRHLAKIARKLGATIVRVFTGHSADETAYSDDWEKCVLRFEEAAVRKISTGLP